ncbi:MAG: asparagine synthetase B family protein [Flavobacteriales bacterium]
MSAIFGYTGNKGSVADIATALRHWQPDREAFFQEEKITLGALELYKTPECTILPQPYRYKDFIVVADCRIDNRSELAKVFSITDISKFSDIHFVAMAYEKWGKDAAKHLVGDFAFAVWNTKTEELFAARDHFGIRSLYYAEVENELVFSSEIKGILAHPRFKKEFNEAYIVSEFSSLTIPVQDTFYKNLFLLPAGHFLQWKNHLLQSGAYWTFGERTVQIPLTLEEQEAEFNRLVFRVISDRLRSYRRLGAESSGGLDSTGIASVAMEILGKGKEFYSYGYGKPANPLSENDNKDDMHVVREMCEKYGILQYVKVVNEEDISAREVSEIMEKVCDDYESNGVPLMSVALLKYAQEQDVGMLFSGWGGDQGVTVTSEGFFANLARAKDYQGLWKDLRRKHSFTKTLPRFVYYTLNTYRKDRYQKIHRKIQEVALTYGPLQPWVIEKYQLQQQPSPNEYLKGACDIQTYFRRNLTYIGLQKRTCDHVLIGRHFRVDYRFPMFDVRLLEYIYSLPFNTISPKGQSRYLFKKLVKPFVPAELISTHKSSVATTPFMPSIREVFGAYMKEQYEANKHSFTEHFFDISKMEMKFKDEAQRKQHQKIYWKLCFFALKTKDACLPD